MKKITPLIFSLLSSLALLGQANGGWGTCEFTTVVAMNAFDPSGSNYTCKKVFVQATNEHYQWDGAAWVLVSDDQIASEVPFTPTGTISSTDVQAAIAEIEPDIYGSIDVHSDVDVTTTPPSSGDLLSWDGSNFVPIDLSADNVSYDNSTSGLTATDVQTAIDELAGGDTSLYTTDAVLTGNRTADLDNFNLQWDMTGTGDFNVLDNGTQAFSVRDNGLVAIGNVTPIAPLHILEATGTAASASDGTIVIEHGDSGGESSIVFKSNVDEGSDYGYISYSDDGSGNGSTTENGLLTIGIEGDTDGSADQDDIAIMTSGSVGVGTISPDAFLDVEGGNVRFSDYGTGTYEDTTAVYLLGVEADGDIIEMNTAKSSRIFYPPALLIDASSTGTSLTLDLHQQYINLFGAPGVVSSGAPSVIPTYDETELYYYVTDYDNTVFSNLSISAAGVLTYDIDAVPTDNCSVLNVVFVVKEP